MSDTSAKPMKDSPHENLGGSKKRGALRDAIFRSIQLRAGSESPLPGQATLIVVMRERGAPDPFSEPRQVRHSPAFDTLFDAPLLSVFSVLRTRLACLFWGGILVRES